MDVAGKRIAIIVDNYFEESEFAGPLKICKDKGMEVRVLGATTLDLQAMNHEKAGGTYKADDLLEHERLDSFDALLFPGGALNADTLRMDELARMWVRDALESGKPVAAICHAPWLLVSAGVVMGRTLTSYYTIQDDIRNAGGEWRDQEVVIDNNLITSRKPDDVPTFCQALLDMLQEAHDNQLNKEVFDE